MAPTGLWLNNKLTTSKAIFFAADKTLDDSWCFRIGFLFVLFGFHWDLIPNAYILFSYFSQGVKGAPYYVGAAQTLPRGMYSDRNKNIIGKLKSHKEYPFLTLKYNHLWMDFNIRRPKIEVYKENTRRERANKKNLYFCVKRKENAWKILKVFDIHSKAVFEHWFM